MIVVAVKLLVWDSEDHDIPVYEMEELLEDCRLSIWEMGINADIVEYYYPDNISYVEAHKLAFKRVYDLEKTDRCILLGICRKEVEFCM